MFFIYFSCAFVASIIVYIDSEKQRMPRWWSAIVFFAPVTIPYYIVKTRRKKSLIPLTAFLVIVILVGVGESVLYHRVKDRIIYSSYSPKAREILRFTEDLKYSVQKLNNLALQLDDMSRVDSSPEKIYEVLAFVKAMQSLMEDNQRAVKKFMLVVNDYRNLLIEENFNWLLKIEEYYNEPVVVKYLRTLAAYLDTFSSLLEYTGEHFQEITAGDSVYIKNYDGYYMNYLRALESHSRIDVNRMQFQHNFLVHAPELEPYLPIILQKRFVNIWKRK
ncbi:MAG: hypothetical protein HQK62_02855 [Desulfamplus sp.]|nr:hypothetical protein [Desulfamplus sp.]